MSDFRQFLEGCKILEQYECGGDYLGAGHDQIWLGNLEKSKRVMHKNDIKKLDELGWFEDEDSWSIFT